MKKFTLFAAAVAMTATCAMAARPVAPVQPAKAATSLRNESISLMGQRADVARTMSSLTSFAAVAAADGADDDVVVVSNEAMYIPAENSFYLGLTPAYYGYRNFNFGLTGIRQRIGFTNLTEGAAGQTWTYYDDMGTDENNQAIVAENVSEDQNLLVDLTPGRLFYMPELKAAFEGADSVSFTSDRADFYYCGRNSFMLGFTTSEETNLSNVAVEDIYGMGVAAVPFNSTTLLVENGHVLPSAAASIGGTAADFTDNGTSTEWVDFFGSASTGIYSNPEVVSFITVIPQMPSAYQLSHMWLACNSNATQDFVLTATVYPITTEGIDYDTRIAEGSVTIPGRTFPTSSDNMPVFELKALDEDGYETELFPSIPAAQAVAVEVTGFNSQNVLYFLPRLYDNTATSLEQRGIFDTLFPTHGYVGLNVDYQADANAEKETLRMEFSNPNLYYTSAARDSIFSATDYAMFFNVEFPVIVNDTEGAEEYGTADFNMHFENGGGTQSVQVYTDYNIETLLAEEAMTATAVTDGDEWISFETATIIPSEDEEAYPYTEVTVTVGELPEGVAGRSGYVLYSGMALDFYVSVTQGEIAGIDDVKVVPVAKGTQYYDLQGRRLSGIPANGVYIQRVNGVTTKHIAR